MNNPGLWTTTREIACLKGFSRALLRKYLDTMHLRDDWGDIDALEVYLWGRQRLDNAS